MFGSGPVTGIARTTIQPWLHKVVLRVIHRDPPAVLTQPNLISRNEYNVVVLFSARTSIARVTWSALAAKAKCAPPAITSAFVA